MRRPSPRWSKRQSVSWPQTDWVLSIRKPTVCSWPPPAKVQRRIENWSLLPLSPVKAMAMSKRPASVPASAQVHGPRWQSDTTSWALVPCWSWATPLKSMPADGGRSSWPSRRRCRMAMALESRTRTMGRPGGPAHRSTVPLPPWVGGWPTPWPSRLPERWSSRVSLMRNTPGGSTRRAPATPSSGRSWSRMAWRAAVSSATPSPTTPGRSVGSVLAAGRRAVVLVVPAAVDVVLRSCRLGGAWARGPSCRPPGSPVRRPPRPLPRQGSAAW